MGTLKVGRVGLDLALGDPANWSESRSTDGREFRVAGFLKSDSVANTKILRSELLEQQGQLIAVTYSLDDHFDAFYILADSRVETIPVSYRGAGIFPFEVNLLRIGGTARTEFQSLLTGTVLENQHGLTATETTPFFAPPIGALSVDWQTATIPTTLTRTTDSGNISVYTNPGDFSKDASWGATPATYYDGACELWVDGRLRSGKDVPNSPDNFRIDNGLIRVFVDNTLSAVGLIGVQHYDGSVWETAKEYRLEAGGFQLGGSTGWNYLSVVQNTPEVVTLMLTLGANIGSKYQVSLSVRRGSRFVQGYLKRVNQTGDVMGVTLWSAEAGTAFTPTGAASAVGVRATSNDAGGNRYVIMTPQSHTTDLVNGGIEESESDSLIRFAIGSEIGGSGASAGDTASDLALQYFGFLSERVRAVWR